MMDSDDDEKNTLTLITTDGTKYPKKHPYDNININRFVDACGIFQNQNTEIL
jgi:hypothetical protein